MRVLIEKIFKQYHREIYKYLYSICRDSSLAEDLTSEVFIEVIKSINKFRGESDLKTWLFSIARHRWYRYLRKNRIEIKTEPMYGIICEACEKTEKTACDNETVERIYKILDGESTLVQNVFRMRTRGYSFYEIGNENGISESSARVIYFRIRQKIKKILTEEGH